MAVPILNTAASALAFFAPLAKDALPRVLGLFEKVTVEKTRFHGEAVRAVADLLKQALISVADVEGAQAGAAASIVTTLTALLAKSDEEGRRALLDLVKQLQAQDLPDEFKAELQRLAMEHEHEHSKSVLFLLSVLVGAGGVVAVLLAFGVLFLPCVVATAFVIAFAVGAFVFWDVNRPRSWWSTLTGDGEVHKWWRRR